MLFFRKTNGVLDGNYRRAVITLMLGVMLVKTIASAATASEPSMTTAITNLHDLKNAVEIQQRSLCALDLEAVVCAANPETSLLTLQDISGVEVISLNLNGRFPNAGERIRIKIARCELTRRKWCISVAAPPVVGNGGSVDVETERFGRINLTAGTHLIRLFYINAKNPANLEVNINGPGIPLQPIPSDMLFLEPPLLAAISSSNRTHGLRYFCYEDSPFSLDDVQYMQPTFSGTTTNFDVSLRRPQEFVAMQFRGLIEVPQAGEYIFSTRADDGCELYVGSLNASVTVISSNAPPISKPFLSRQSSSILDEWLTVEGRVTFAGDAPDGLEIEIKDSDGSNPKRLWLATSEGMPLPVMLNARVRATGVSRSIIGLDGRKTVEHVSVINATDLHVLSVATEQWAKHPLTTITNVLAVSSETVASFVHLKGKVVGLPASGGFVLDDGAGTIRVRPTELGGITNGLTVEVLGGLAQRENGLEMHPAFCRRLELSPSALPELTTSAQIQQLSAVEAAQQYPATVRGVVTCIVEWGGGVIQDSTRGVFFTFQTFNREGIVVGDFVEVKGVTAVGDFAPSITAQKIQRLGRGQLPEPVIANWKQLVSGSLDSQYAEVRGIITAIERNQATLLTDNGKIIVTVHDMGEETLRKYLNTLVRIRGCLLAEWDAKTRQVKVGEIVFRNPKIEIDQLPITDPFSAPSKTISDLLMFDLQASGFQRVKVSGQIVQVRGEEFFLMQNSQGLRFQHSGNTDLKAGDTIDVVGIPDLSGISPRLHETVVRKTGTAQLPPPLPWRDAANAGRNLDALRVRMEAHLIGLHHSGLEWVLELQTDLRAYRALISTSENLAQSFPLGSLLQLSGVHATLNGERNDSHSAFELLLNSTADIRLIARPPWWNLQRLLITVAALVAVLTGSVIWIKQLHKQVAQRTVLLEREHTRRERAERERALEFERARIARDLHDDLGARLSEIRVMASTGQRLSDTSIKAPSIFLGITEKAQDLIAALDVIVWAVDPEANSLQSLADYLSGYATEYLMKSGVTCRFKIPVSMPPVLLEGRIRHDLFLVVKETLHNIVQHSKATLVELHLTSTENKINIAIIDNGCGFDLEVARTKGHGLRNMSERVTNNGGHCTIVSNLGTGTRIHIQLPLPVDIEKHVV